jgi:two-component system cell cycle response regulator DivK
MLDPKIKKVLLADDNQTFLMYMGILLKRMGFTVIPAENGLEVLKLLKIVEPDVVMLDIRMGTMDGMAILKYIKEDKQTSNIPVVMVSSDSSKEMIEKCRRLGCAGYLTKPVKIDRLHEALENCVFSQIGAKRKYLRASANKKVVVAHDGKKYKLYTETLSERGVYIREKDPLPVGSEVEVILPLEDGDSLQLKGVVAHVKGLFGDVFAVPGMGIRFKEITDDQVRILKNYIGKLIAEDILDSQEEAVIKLYEDREDTV